MKKLFTLLTMLVLGIGSFAQTHHSTETGTNTLNAATIKAKAQEGDLYVSIQNHTTTANYYINYEGKGTNSFSDAGYTTWKVVPHNEGYALQRIYDGKYIYQAQRPVTFTDNLENALLFMPTDCGAGVGDIGSGYNSNKAVRWKLKDNTSLQMNTNGMNTGTTVQFNNGTGNWTCLFTYEVTVKYQVTFSCKVSETLIYTESALAKAGDQLNVPDLPGYSASPSSVTVGNEAATENIVYTATSYPVNFTRGQTFTRSDRHINSVDFSYGGGIQTVDGVYTNTSTNCYQDLTESKMVTLPVNTSVQPKFTVAGTWQHGFVYIDLNKDGDFTDEGELVSKINEGNPNLSTAMPSFITPYEPGEYRMRIKTDWASEDPGGNTGADPHKITSSNHIIANGGMIVDVNLVISAYEVTYQVQDENEKVLFTSEPVATTNGAHITTLPEAYQKTDFYEYNTLDITISEVNTTATFTATKKTKPLVKFSSDASSAYYYNLKIRGKYMVYNSGATGEVTLQDNSEPFNPNAAWAFIGNPYAGFKVINKTKGTDYFLTYTEVTTSRPSGNNVQFLEDANFQDRYWLIESNTGGICLRMKENTNIYFHHENNGNYLRTCSKTEWGSVHNDPGSTIVASTDEDVLIALYNSMKDYTYGTAIGQYSAEGLTAADANLTITQVGAAITNNVTAAYADCYSALNTLQAKTTLNTPAAGFYRVKNVATNGYLYATAASDYTSTNRYVYANGSNSGAETIIQLVDHDGHLYMLNQGHEFGWVAQSSTSVLSGEVGYVRDNNFDKYVNWLPGTAAGQIAFAICYGNGTGDYASYLTQGIYAVDTNDNAVIRGTEGYTANTAQWVFEPATELSITLNNGGDGNYYATLCVPFDVTISDATAYTLAKSESGNYLVPTEVDQVPAGTPVLLKGTNATATATINTGSAFNDGSTLDCALTGIYVTTSVDATTNYVFGKFNGKVGFYHVNNNAFSLKANRAYLEATTDQARGFVLNFDDDATGIVAPTADTAGEATIYNLSGQRLNKVQKGINIVNGKKVLF